MKDQRSTIDPTNLQQIIDAGVSVKAATLTGQQQYSTPPEWAEFFAGLLPCRDMGTIFDPQCAGGNTVTRGIGWYPHRYGFEIDNRYANQGDNVRRLTGNCVKLWELLDNLYPDLRFDCQNANPPFAIQWKIEQEHTEKAEKGISPLPLLPPVKTCDSTEYTWRKITERAAEGGFGYFISNYKTIERLGIDKHPWVYLYQKFPAGFWKGTTVEIGVVHWQKTQQEKAEKAENEISPLPPLPPVKTPPLHLTYTTLNPDEHEVLLRAIRNRWQDYDTRWRTPRDADGVPVDRNQVARAWDTIETILEEESTRQPEFNIWQDANEMLHIHLSTRTTIQRKLTRDDVLMLTRINKTHPLTLTTEAETRKILRTLLDCGFYTIEPKAKAAIEAALVQVAGQSAPTMPVGPFARVAYADEMDALLCIQGNQQEHTEKAENGISPRSPLPPVKNSEFHFTKGRKYPLTTATYTFQDFFTRVKRHMDEDGSGEEYNETHKCSITGQDRYIQVIDDRGIMCRFMDKPKPANPDQELHKHVPLEFPEHLLWEIFQEPVVATIKETEPALYAANREELVAIATKNGFTFYDGQLEYLARVLCRGYGLIAADTGCGKTLFTIATILIKKPHRALIIAPQGTLRGEDEEEEFGTTPSQWVAELKRFTPHTPVFEIFTCQDYLDLKEKFGDLPTGVYISYYEAMFRNGARPAKAVWKGAAKETLPDTWDHKKLCSNYGWSLGPTFRQFQLSNPDYPGRTPEWTHEDIVKDMLASSESGTIENCKLKILNFQSLKIGDKVGGYVILGIAEIPENNYTLGVGDEKGGIRCLVEPCLTTLIGHEFDMVCLDEAHIVTNLDACVTQMLLRMQPKYRYAFTATPIPNVISNLFSVMGWLCVPGWYKGAIRNAAWPYSRSELGKFDTTFRSEERDYTQEQKNALSNPKWKGKCTKVSPVISSPARLLKLITPTLAFISKETCNPLTVPCKVIDLRVPLGKEQAKLYGHFLKRDNIPCGNPLIRARKQIAYLRGITADPAGFQYGGPHVGSNFNPKTVAILELTRELLGKGEQVVIVCARVGQTNSIASRMREAGIEFARIDSTFSAADHSAQANLFKSGKVKVMFMGIKCAKGFSFDTCPNLIIGSLEYSYASLHQAKGRVWRVNSRNAVTVYCVLHKETIEETMFDLVSGLGGTAHHRRNEGIVNILPELAVSHVLATKQDAATICLHGKRVPREFRPVDMGEVLAETVSRFASEGRDELECEAEWPALRTALEATKYGNADIPVCKFTTPPHTAPEPVLRLDQVGSQESILRVVVSSADVPSPEPGRIDSAPIPSRIDPLASTPGPAAIELQFTLPTAAINPANLSIWQLRRMERLSRCA